MNASDTIRAYLGTLGVSNSPAGLIIGERQTASVNGVSAIAATSLSAVVRQLSLPTLGADDALLFESIGGTVSCPDTTGGVQLVNSQVGIGNTAGGIALPLVVNNSGTLVGAAFGGTMAVQNPPALRKRDIPGINQSLAIVIDFAALLQNTTAAAVNITVLFAAIFRVISGVQP